MKNLFLLSFALTFSPFNVANEDEHSDMHDLMAHLLTPASEGGTGAYDVAKRLVHKNNWFFAKHP